MNEPNEYFKKFVDDHGGVEEVARISQINRQTIRQAYLGRNGVSTKVAAKMAEAFGDFRADRLILSSRNLTEAATDEPGENEVNLLKAKIKLLEESLEHKNRTIKEREATIRFLAATHPEYRQQLEDINFNQGVTKERFKNRGPIHKKDEFFFVTWPQNQADPTD